MLSEEVANTNCIVYSHLMEVDTIVQNIWPDAARGNGNDQVNYCTRSTAECNSSHDHFHYRRPNILNYCNHVPQITVLLPNHTLHLWTLQQTQHHSQTTVLYRTTNFSQSGNFIKGHTGSMQIIKTIAGW